MNLPDVAAALARYTPIDAIESGYRQQTIEYLSARATPSHISPRNFSPGHITASAFLLNATRTHAALIHHTRSARWIAPSDHIASSDTSPLSAAIRTAIDTSGIDGVRPLSQNIFDIDVQTIPACHHPSEPAHTHYEIRYLLMAPTDIFSISEDSTSLQWMLLKEILVLPSPSLIRLAAKAQLFLKNFPAAGPAKLWLENISSSSIPTY